MSRRPIGTPDHMQLFECPERGCTLRVLTERGEYTTHKCPHAGGETRISWMTYGPSLLQQLWDEMDKATDVVMHLDRDSTDSMQQLDWERASARARGLAFALSLFMFPHLKTEDEVVFEAVHRYEGRRTGEERVTPGLGSRVYEPPPGDNKYAVLQSPAPSNKPRLPRGITQDVYDTIKASPFPNDMLAKIYHLSEADVSRIKSGA